MERESEMTYGLTICNRHIQKNTHEHGPINMVKTKRQRHMGSTHNRENILERQTKTVPRRITRGPKERQKWKRASTNTNRKNEHVRRQTSRKSIPHPRNSNIQTRKHKTNEQIEHLQTNTQNTTRTHRHNARKQPEEEIQIETSKNIATKKADNSGENITWGENTSEIEWAYMRKTRKKKCTKYEMIQETKARSSRRVRPELSQIHVRANRSFRM